MAWLKLTDHFDDDPDLALLSGDAVALFVCMMSYSARQLTDGFISEIAIKKIPFFTKKTLEKLMAPGVEWVKKTDGGFVIRNYLFYNPSAEEVKAKKDKLNLRVKRHRSKEEPTKHVTEDVTPPVTKRVCNAPPVPVPVPSLLSEDTPHPQGESPDDLIPDPVKEKPKPFKPKAKFPPDWVGHNPPTRADVARYMAEQNWKDPEGGADEFILDMEAKEWCYGKHKTPLKSWQGHVRTIQRMRADAGRDPRVSTVSTPGVQKIYTKAERQAMKQAQGELI